MSFASAQSLSVERRPERERRELAMALAATGLWTGSPLLAVWIGSRVQHSYAELSMGAVAVHVARNR